MTAVETTNLTKEYGDVLALDGLDLSVDEGELYGLLGPNGSGKTTTIEILTGQRVPTAGEASVLGVDPVENPIDVRRSVGILPEREDPPSFLSPREYLEFVGDIRDIDDVEDRIEEWSSKLEFRGILDTLSTDLSEGERQRVMLAQVFIHEPELVFIDEPLVNLDPLMQATVKEHLTGYCEAGNTLFLSTHFMEVAEELCTRVGIIANGKMRAERDPRTLDEDLLETFATEVGTVAEEPGPGAEDTVADGSGGAGTEGTGNTEGTGGTGETGGRGGTEGDSA